MSINRLKSTGVPNWFLMDPGEWMEQFQGAGKLTGTANAYAKVPLIFRAVRMRADAIAKVPSYIMRGTTESQWPFKSKLPALLWKTEASLNLTGAAYWLKLRNSVRTLDVQWLNPYSVKVEWKDNRRIFSQPGTNPPGGPWTDEDMVYFREFGAGNDIMPGECPASVAMGDAQLIYYINRFASSYFESGAMPVTLLGFENINDDEKKRVENWFKKMATGLKNAWRVLALRGNVDPKILTPAPKDLTMPELDKEAVQNIAWAFSIPQTMLFQAANYATSREDRLSFWQDTMQPRGTLYEDTVDEQLLDPLGLALELAWEELELFQEDEADRATSLKTLTDAGIPLDVALEILGYDLDDDQWARIMEQISAPPVVTIVPNPQLPATTEMPTDQGDMGKSVAKWQRKALDRVKAGRKPYVTFESAAIRATLSAAILGGLEAAQTGEDVRRVFKGLQTGEVYP